jgi:hypothetical protein
VASLGCPACVHIDVSKRTIAAVGLLAGLLLAIAPGAFAAPLRLLASPVVAFSSDGVRYAAWQGTEQSPIVVLDTRTGRQATYPAPAGCRLLDQAEGSSYEPTAAAGRVLIDCVQLERERQQLLDMRTGDVTPLPEGIAWEELGTRYVRGEDADEHQLVRNLASGATERVGDDEFADLDRPGVPRIRSVCPRLRARVRAEAGYLAGSFAYASGVLARALGQRGELEVARCRGRALVLGGQRLGGKAHNHLPRDFDLRGGLLSWDTGSYADTTAGGEGGPDERGFHSRLNALGLASARHRTWALPRVALEDAEADSYGYSTHTANTVFWVATRSLAFGESGPSVQTYSLYSARL